ncbi:MAG: hypothetical protein PVJ72_13860 [Gammaproteobacteria bacterium]
MSNKTIIIKTMSIKTIVIKTMAATALLLPLSLWAEPMEHSSAHYEQTSEMLHPQNGDMREHSEHDAHMMQDSSEHHSMPDTHHGNTGEHRDVETMDMQDASEHHKMDHSAQQVPHGEHAMHGEPAKSAMKSTHSESLSTLKTMPSSGRSREAGYDDRYAMESTSASNSLQTQCAQASRGLIMIDNATWAKCGGKPEGWSKGIADAATDVHTMDHGEHMGH